MAEGRAVVVVMAEAKVRSSKGEREGEAAALLASAQKGSTRCQS